MLDVKLPSKDKTPINNVKTTPKNHTMLDLKNPLNLFIWTLLVILDIITSTVIIDIIGIIKFFIIFAINSIKNNKIGSMTAVVVIFPVYAISVIRSGTKVSENPTKFSIVSFTSFNISEKFDIIIVTIKIYCT